MLIRSIHVPILLFIRVHNLKFSYTYTMQTASQLNLEKKETPLLFTPSENMKHTLNCGQFSFFAKPVTNIHPSGQLTPRQAYELLTGDRYAAPTRVLRTLTDKDQARGYKSRNFDYACFSGIFSTRAEKGLIKHSGFLTLDLDHLSNPAKLKNELIRNPSIETVLAFVSPSGNGLKWIVKIDLEKATHLDYFWSLESYLKTHYRIEVDPSGKDVARCCFLCFDPEAYLNPNYL